MGVNFTPSPLFPSPGLPFSLWVTYGAKSIVQQGQDLKLNTQNRYGHLRIFFLLSVNVFLTRLESKVFSLGKLCLSLYCLVLSALVLSPWLVIRFLVPSRGGAYIQNLSLLLCLESLEKVLSP